MPVIRYRGESNVRRITSAEFAAVGIVGIPTLSWQKSNGYEIEVDSVTAAFLLAEGDFEAGDPNDTFASMVSGGGRILGAAENAIGANTAGTTSVPFGGGGLVKNVTVGIRPILIKFGGQVYHTTAGGTPQLLLYENGVLIEAIGQTCTTANALNMLFAEKYRTPAAGIVTYEVQFAQATAVATAVALPNGYSPHKLIIQEG